MSQPLATARDRIAVWRNEPWTFVADHFRVTPDAWQMRVLKSIKPRGINRICMKACAGPGKTAVEAWLGWHRLACFAERVGPNAYEHPKGAALAITEDNMRSNLWPELAKWRQRSAFLDQAFEQTGDFIRARDHPETWFLGRRSYSKTANPEEQGRTLSGLHGFYPFILLDESGDMHPSVGRAAEQAMGGCVSGLIAQGGNTTSMSGLLYDSAVTHAPQWVVVTITADPDDPERTTRVDIEWAREQIKEHTRKSPWVQAYILGEFPSAAFNQLISSDEVEASQKRVIVDGMLAGLARVMGIDVARFGDDESAWARRQGPFCHDIEIARNLDTIEIAGRTLRHIQDWHPDGVFFDGTGGWAGGSVDQLRAAHHEVFEINYSSEASDARYANKRAQMWFLMAHWIKRSGKLPDDPVLKRELVAPTYTFQKGRLLIEPKELIKKRLGFSPNRADSLSQTFAMPVVPRPQDAFGTPLNMGVPGASTAGEDDRDDRHRAVEADHQARPRQRGRRARRERHLWLSMPECREDYRSCSRSPPPASPPSPRRR